MDHVRSCLWRSKGYGKEDEVPSNYVPFWHYVESAWGSCDGAQDQLTSNRETSPRLVYIATDDPETVRRELDALPKSSDGSTVVNSCQDTANVVFAPSSKETRFHLKDGGNDDDCHTVYERNIAALADLFVLARSDKFVGDYNSNWYVRNFCHFVEYISSIWFVIAA
jgi:hypothetical protein